MDARLDARIDQGTVAHTKLAAAWPPFALRVRTERLELWLPTDDDLLDLVDLARSGIHPPGEMPFGVPWSTLESPGFERGFLAYHWGNRASWAPGSWELGLAASLDGTLIGMQGMSASRFSATRTVHTGSWLGRSFQGAGFGKEMRAAVLALAFDGLGAQFAETEAFLDNAASNAVSRALGYADSGFGSLAPEGVPRETRRFRLTHEGWRSRPRSPVEIEGLTGCQELFGA
ncbi:MAG: GNAT family protein [Candidatus Limnocylindrales bacterium]